MSTALLSSMMFEGQSVRILGTRDDPLWVAADVCACLGIANSRDLMSRIPSEEKGVAPSDTLGGTQEMSALRLSGVFRAVFRSDKAEAERFRAWMFREVLPSIFHTGTYSLTAVAVNSAGTVEERLARLEKRASYGLAARVERLEAKVGQLPLFLEAPAKPKPNVRPALKAKEIARNAAREERLQRLIRVWGEEFGNEFTPLKEALQRSQRIADLAAELGDEVRHLLREANTRGLVEGTHNNKFNTKAWRPCAAERN